MKYIKKVSVAQLQSNTGTIIDSMNPGDDHHTNAPSIDAVKNYIDSVVQSIWTGNVYTKQSSTSLSTTLESGKLYAFVVKGNSSNYTETIPFIFDENGTLVQHTSYNGTTMTRWRIEVSSNSFYLDNNSLNMDASTAITILYKLSK